MLVAKLAYVGVNMNDEEKFQIFLCPLSNFLSSLVMAINATFIILKIEDVVGS